MNRNDESKESLPVNPEQSADQAEPSTSEPVAGERLIATSQPTRPQSTPKMTVSS